MRVDEPWRRRLKLRSSLAGWMSVATLVLLVATGPLCPGQMVENTHRVLVLHSYHRADWSESILRGVSSVLGDDSGVQIRVEYMDTKWMQTPEYMALLRTLYVEKYSTGHFDAVITSDDKAFRFVLANGDDVFPGAPLIFCGVNDFFSELIAGRTNVTGVVEKGDFRETLQVALRMKPEAKQVFVICDHTDTGEVNLRDFEDKVAELGRDLEIVKLVDVSYRELCDALATAPPDAFAFFISFWHDALDSPVEPSHLEKAFRGSAIPVFGRSEWMMSRGLVGGKCVSGFQQGSIAGQMACGILDGVPPSLIPVMLDSPNVFIFDDALLREYGLPESAVPEGSLLLNQPSPFFSVRKDVLAITVGSLAALLLLVGLLAWVESRLRATQKKLQMSEQSYSEVFNGVVEALFLHDAETGDILEVNDAMLRMYGCRTVEEARSLDVKSLNEGQPPYGRTEAQAHIRRATTEGPQVFEWLSRRRNGETFWAEVSLKLARIGGRDIVIAAVRDISDRKRAQEANRELEQRIQHAQKLESLGVLAGGIAHDFNNLLVAMLGHADLALMELPPASSVNGSIAEIKKAAVRASELTNQMLAYSGKGRFVVETVDANDVVRDLMSLLQACVPKHVELRVNLADLGALVEADVTQLRQVIMNLVTNAAEAIGDHEGLVTVTGRVKEVDRQYLSGAYLGSEVEPGRYVSLTITDSGCGVDAQTLARLFDPFYTTKTHGRGLGLAAVLGIVRGHHGAIRIDSTPGRGTRFEVLLPASSGGAPSSSHGASHAAEELWRGHGTVLVVDDEETVRTMASSMLERLGFSVLTASDGIEALDIFRHKQDQIVLVLLDLTMPHLDGADTYEGLRRISQDVDIILTSGYSEHEVSKRFAGKNVAGFLHKPYDLAQLREALNGAGSRPMPKPHAEADGASPSAGDA